MDREGPLPHRAPAKLHSALRIFWGCERPAGACAAGLPGPGSRRTAKVPIDQNRGLDEIVEVHRRMRENEASGKMVVIN